MESVALSLPSGFLEEGKRQQLLEWMKVIAQLLPCQKCSVDFWNRIHQHGGYEATRHRTLLLMWIIETQRSIQLKLRREPAPYAAHYNAIAKLGYNMESMAGKSMAEQPTFVQAKQAAMARIANTSQPATVENILFHTFDQLRPHTDQQFAPFGRSFAVLMLLGIPDGNLTEEERQTYAKLIRSSAAMVPSERCRAMMASIVQSNDPYKNTTRAEYLLWLTSAHNQLNEIRGKNKPPMPPIHAYEIYKAIAMGQHETNKACKTSCHIEAEATSTPGGSAATNVSVSTVGGEEKKKAWSNQGAWDSQLSAHQAAATSPQQHVLAVSQAASQGNRQGCSSCARRSASGTGSSSSKLPPGVIAVLVFCGVLLVGAAVAGVVLVLRRKKSCDVIAGATFSAPSPVSAKPTFVTTRSQQPSTATQTSLQPRPLTEVDLFKTPATGRPTLEV